MAQVKFYSKSSLPTGDALDENGVYFIQGGELYKGSQRFGLGKVTVASSTEGITGMERGDIVVTGAGDGWVYAGAGEGKGWKSLGGNIESLRSSWRSDISTWTAGLVQSGAGSYITGITQGEDGKVTAQASNFALDVKTAVGDSTSTSTSNGVTVSVTTISGIVTGVEVTAPTLGTGTSDGTVKLGNGTDAKVSGWDALVGKVSDNTTAIGGLSTKVSTLETKVSGIEGIVDVSNGGTVTASSGVFTNLTVSDTATFSATTVSASTLTVGGVAVDNIAASTATSTASGVAVTVSTANGGVKKVDVAVTKADLNDALGTTNVADKTIATSIRASGTAVDTALATEKAVRDALNAFDNAMHFKGVVKELPSTGEAGDIVVIGKDPTGSGLVEGQEYIYDGTNWEKIGDQSAVTGGTSTSTVNNVSVQVVTAAATAAPSVTLTGVGTAASKAFATTVTAGADTLPTGGAVATYVTGITDTKAIVGTGNATGGYGISGQVVLSSNVDPALTITVNAVSTKAGVSNGDKAGQVVTAGAVNGFVADSITSAMSYSSGATVYNGVTTVPGALNAVGAAVDTLNSTIDGYVGGNSSDEDSGVSVEVTINASTMAPTVEMTVNEEELKTALNLGAAASMGVTTSLIGSNDDLPTDAAVKTYVDTALTWIEDN